MEPNTWQKGYTVVAWIFILGIILQVLFVGLAMFAGMSESWMYHVQLIRYVFFLPLIMALLAYFAGLGRRAVLRCLGLFLMVIGMFFTANIATYVGLLGALHPVLAVFIFWVAIKVLQAK